MVQALLIRHCTGPPESPEKLCNETSARKKCGISSRLLPWHESFTRSGSLIVEPKQNCVPSFGTKSFLRRVENLTLETITRFYDYIDLV